MESRGFNPISERSYRHYQKLARYGYERYVPINQLDVETLRDPVWDTSLRARYRHRKLQVDALVLMVIKDQLVVIGGKTLELSEVDALVEVRGSDLASLRPLRGALEGRQVLAVLGRSDEGKSAQIDVVDWPNEENTQAAEIRISFLEIVLTREVTPRIPLPTVPLRFSMDVEDSEFLITDVRSMNLFLEAVESTRIVCDEALAQLDKNQAFAIDPPRLRHISKSNPITIGVDAAIGVVVVFSGFVGMFLRHRLTWYQGGILQQHGNLIQQQASVVEKEARILDEYARSLAIRNAQDEFRRQLDPAAFVPYIIDAIKKQLPGDVSDAEIDPSPIAKLVDFQLLPSIDKLLDPKVNQITQNTDVPAPPLNPDGTPVLDEDGTGGETPSEE